MLSKRDFLKACKGHYYYDEYGYITCKEGTLYVDFGDEQVGIQWTHKESYPFENVYYFDNMPIEEAMENEVLDRLYEEYVAQKEDGCLWLGDLEKDF